MALERKWLAVTAKPFTANGTSIGIVTVADTSGFRVKQLVFVLSNSVQPTQYQVNAVISITQLVLGPVGPKVGSENHSDLSALLVADSATIAAPEQVKSQIPDKDHYLAVYEAEPIVADRVILVDQNGKFYDTVVDNNGVRRLAVDGQFHAEVDVQVDVDVDGFYDPATNPDPDNIGLIGHQRSNPTDQTKQTQRITAKRGTTDTDTVSQDVSLHDYNGNKYDINNPVPTTGSFEKFFQLIGDSKWMALATYDQVVPTYSNGGRTLTLAYMESGNLIGEAVIVYNSEIDYSLQLKRYINNDGEGLLLNDDNTPLNLD